MSALRRARERAGMTREELAAAVGLRPATVRQAETRGIRVLSWPRVVKLARALAADPLALL